MIKLDEKHIRNLMYEKGLAYKFKYRDKESKEDIEFKIDPIADSNNYWILINVINSGNPQYTLKMYRDKNRLVLKNIITHNKLSATTFDIDLLLEFTNDINSCVMN